jgi:hypothetical protein
MNFQPPSPKGGLHRTLRVLSLLLLQHALVPTSTDVHARSRLPSNPDSDPVPTGNSRPYLKIAGSLPLRFGTAPRPIPILASKASVSNPPPQPIAATPVEPAPAPLSPVIEEKNPPTEPPIVPVSTPVESKRVLSILPDDTHPSTRPEDFLPFFQFPAGRNVNVVVPAGAIKPTTPGQLPASSATYQQR